MVWIFFEIIIKQANVYAKEFVLNLFFVSKHLTIKTVLDLRICVLVFFYSFVYRAFFE